MSSNRRGTIVAAFGRHYEIEFSDGTTTTGYPLGKKSIYTCGDEVDLSDDGQILSLHPRRTLFYRADGYREKLIAANVTQLVLVVATEPSFSDALLTRALVEMCAKQDVTALKTLLNGQVSVLVGQSGMGKSTLTNALIPGAMAATREVSVALDSGKHTTTHARLYRLPVGADSTPSIANAALIDCPGLQEFGLSHLTPAEIGHGFLEFRPLLGQCRFRDCQHRSEPGCAIKTAIESGDVHPRRLEHFHQLVAALGRI